MVACLSKARRWVLQIRDKYAMLVEWEGGRAVTIARAAASKMKKI